MLDRKKDTGLLVSICLIYMLPNCHIEPILQKESALKEVRVSLFWIHSVARCVPLDVHGVPQNLFYCAIFDFHRVYKTLAIPNAENSISKL